MTTAHTRRLSLRVTVNLLLLLVVATLLYPFVLMLLGSLKSQAELAVNPVGLPSSPTFQNYLDLIGYSGGALVRGFFNSVFVAGAHTALTVFLCGIAAYTFAKLPFPGRSVIFYALLGTMMIPHEVNLAPLFILFANINWLDSYQVQIMPGIASVFGLFLVRQYMLAIPDELLEAARLDGAGPFRIFWHVMFPLSAPALSALAVLVFVAKWNDYLWPLIMVNDPDLQPVMVLLPTLNTQDNTWLQPWPLVLAGCVAVTVPMILAFIFFQRKFISSLTAGAMKD